MRVYVGAVVRHGDCWWLLKCPPSHPLRPHKWGVPFVKRDGQQSLTMLAADAAQRAFEVDKTLTATINDPTREYVRGNPGLPPYLSYIFEFEDRKKFGPIHSIDKWELWDQATIWKNWNSIAPELQDYFRKTFRADKR